MVRRVLEAAGFTVIGEATDGRSGMTTVRSLHPTLALVDVQLPDVDGFAVADALSGSTPDTLVVLTSAAEASELGDEHLAPYHFVPKPTLSRAVLAALVEDIPARRSRRLVDHDSAGTDGPMNSSRRSPRREGMPPPGPGPSGER